VWEWDDLAAERAAGGVFEIRVRVDASELRTLD